MADLSGSTASQRPIGRLQWDIAAEKIAIGLTTASGCALVLFCAPESSNWRSESSPEVS
jgi:hypothetical protein